MARLQLRSSQGRSRAAHDMCPAQATRIVGVGDQAVASVVKLHGAAAALALPEWWVSSGSRKLRRLLRAPIAARTPGGSRGRSLFQFEIGESASESCDWVLMVRDAEDVGRRRSASSPRGIACECPHVDAVK